MKLILRVSQVIATLILVPVLYILTMELNVLLAVWYSTFKWIWIIFFGFTITFSISLIIITIISFCINLLKRNTIAPRLIQFTLIPILLFIAYLYERDFYDYTDFDNGKQIFSFILFTYMDLSTLIYTIVVLILNKIEDN